MSFLYEGPRQRHGSCRRRGWRGPGVVLLAAGCGSLTASADETADEAPRVHRRLVAMGTHLELEVEGETRAAALAASERAVRAIEATEARLSTWRADSELSRLNGAPVGVPFATSAELARDLGTVLRLRDDTGGAFDPGIGRLVEAWGLRSGGRLPAPGEIEAALEVGGLDSLELTPRGAVRRHAGLVIEEGAFGKGVGLDAACAALVEAGVRSASVDLGGQVAVLEGTPRTFGIADPRDRERVVLSARIQSGSLATSANSERGIVVGGVRRAHILDPRTGAPVDDFGSLTVWAADATTADALSTGLYVLGPEAALAWARGRAGVEVVALVAGEGGALEVRATAGWRGRLEPRAPGLSITYVPEDHPSRRSRP